MNLGRVDVRDNGCGYDHRSCPPGECDKDKENCLQYWAERAGQIRWRLDKLAGTYRQRENEMLADLNEAKNKIEELREEG